MSNVNVEKEFFRLLELTKNKFYVPTEEHSSGFNQIEVYDMEDGTYSITIEDNCCVDMYLDFEGLKAEFPKFTLDNRFAFFGTFETWDRFERALKGEISIDIITL